MAKADESQQRKDMDGQEARPVEKRSGEGAASALARLRSLERAKALERTGRKGNGGS